MRKKLTERLNLCKMTVEDLANKTGIDEYALSSFIEGDSDELTVGMILQICEALDCSPEDLML